MTIWGFKHSITPLILYNIIIYVVSIDFCIIEIPVVWGNLIDWKFQKSGPIFIDLFIDNNELPSFSFTIKLSTKVWNHEISEKWRPMW